MELLVVYAWRRFFARGLREPAAVSFRFLFVVTVLVAPLAADEPTWTQWRGPGRDGFVAVADWPDGLSSDRLERRWRVPLGKSYSGPVLADLGEGRSAVIVTETRDVQS